MKRTDAKQVYDIPAFNKIFPFMMKRRCDSLVFHSFKVDITHTNKWIHEYNASKPEVRMRFFYIFCAALMRTYVDRPEMNRFIASHRYWQRNELSMNFIVKESMKDESPETGNPIHFKPEMTLPEYAKVMDDYINSSKDTGSGNNSTDSMIKILLHIPYCVIGAFIRILGFLERLGLAPKFVREADGLHTSAFVSNLGSIGISGSSPHHHLYEWGTTSLFATVGSPERKKIYDEEGNLKETKIYVDASVTVDERITSGFYFVKSVLLWQHYIEHPEELMIPPAKIPDPPMTKRQYRKYLRETEKKKKAAAKAAAESK